MKITAAVLVLLAAVTIRTSAQTPLTASWEEVARTLGRDGEERDGVYRVTFPRSDLRVRVGGVTVRAALALTSWAAFQKHNGATMMMGDLVLTANELSPALSRLSEAGIEITAVHNHLSGEQPRVMYVHYHGHGEASQLAGALRSALAATATPPATPRRAQTATPATPDPQQLAEILGYQPAVRGGVVAFSIARAEKIAARGASFGPRMGVATAINFQADGSGAAATGDFVLLAEEVQPVIQELRRNHIQVTALHNHMLDEQPRLFFLHFWGRGRAEDLAKGFRAALNRTHHAPAN